MTEFTNMVPSLGIETVESGDGRAVGEMAHRPDLTQATGVFHAGAIFTLADTMATVAGWTFADPNKEHGNARFPLAIQSNCNFIGNAGEGKLIAESRVIHGGRTTIVAETIVKSEADRQVALITTTMIVPDSRQTG
jgi:uncharacterized protein (TIGR00369 family)